MLSCKIAASGDVRFRLNFNRNGGETGFGAIYSAMQQMGLFTRHKSYADMLQRLESFNIGTFSKIRPRCSRERDPTRCSSQRIYMAAVVRFGWAFELSQNESEPELTLAMCSCHVVKIFHSTETICAHFNFGRGLGLPEETWWKRVEVAVSSGQMQLRTLLLHSLQ